MPFALAEIQRGGWLLRAPLVFTDEEEAAAVALDWRSRRGFACVGVVDMDACKLIWRSDRGSLSLPYLGCSQSSLPPKF